MLNQEEFTKITNFVNKNLKGATKKKLLAYIEANLVEKENPLDVAAKGNFESRRITVTKLPPRNSLEASEQSRNNVSIRTAKDGQRADAFRESGR